MLTDNLYSFSNAALIGKQMERQYVPLKISIYFTIQPLPFKF